MRSRAPLLLAAALALAPLTGCTAPAPTPEGPIAFETIEQGSNSGIEERGTVAVRNSTAFEDLWTRHKADESGDPGIPNVDFEERMVLAVFKGESPDGCHGAEITNVTGADGELHVEGAWVEIQGAACTQQVTHPFHVVSIPRYDVPVRFDVTEEVRQRGETGGSDDGNETSDPEPRPGSGEEGTYTCRTRDGGSTGSAGGSNVSLETVEQGSNSGIEEECLTVARNDTAWRDLWRDHTSRQTNPDERPAVNFSDEIVVAVFKGQSPDGCHGAEISNLTADGDQLVVHGAFVVVEGAACTQQVTYPFHIVTTDRHEGPIAFDVENETRER